MTETNPCSETSNSTKPAHPIRRRMASLLFKFVLPILIVGLSLGYFKHLMDTRPKARRRPPEREARLVTVQPAQKTDTRAIVPAMGTVTPARQITLSPEVSGIITWIDPALVPGGLVQAGQVLYEIDRRDYEAIVKQRESELAAARLNLKLETGSQAVAQEAYNLLDEIVEEHEKELVLRRPQLESARQAVEAAQAALAKARLDVERCSIRAPFNAVINAKHADLGARVSPTTALAVLTGTDEFWVEAPVPMSQLKWIDIPRQADEQGSKARIYLPAAWGQGVYREGRVIRLHSELEQQGRMVCLLVSVPDPLHLKNHDSLPPLLVGSYVRVEILGRVLTGVTPLLREHLRDDGFAWIMNERDELEIRPVDVVFRAKDTVFVSDGIREGERIVTTDLSTPVAGMPLRIETPAPVQTAAAEEQAEVRR